MNRSADVIAQNQTSVLGVSVHYFAHQAVNQLFPVSVKVAFDEFMNFLRCINLPFKINLIMLIKCYYRR